MNKIQFSVAAFAAWAPGLNTINDWNHWCSDANYLNSNAETEPKLKAVSPLLRRRTDMPGKMAIEVAFECLGKRRDIPTVFCSRHGEVARSVVMLESLVQEEPLSPTSFSLSVHNAIAGLFSIARSDQANNIVISSRNHLVESAVIEGCSLLHGGAEQVLIVVYDSVLPSVYKKYSDRKELSFAWAWLIQRANSQKDIISLEWKEKGLVNINKTSSLPDELNIWRFFLSHETYLCLHSDDQQWIWRRHAE